MVGAIAGDIVMHAKPVGRGYVKLEPSADHPWYAGSTPLLAAHEFHYSSLDNLPPDSRFAYRVKRGHGIDGERDGIMYKNLLASYTHLRATAGCDWPARFVGFIRSEARQGEKQRCSA
jgi:cobyrinic acid a,c-diamide synthase